MWPQTEVRKNAWPGITDVGSYTTPTQRDTMTAVNGTTTTLIPTIEQAADANANPKEAIAIQWYAEKAAEQIAKDAYENALEERQLSGEQAAGMFTKDELITLHGNKTVRFTSRVTGQPPTGAILAAILPTLTETQREIYDAHMAEYEANRGEAYAFAEPTAAQRKAARQN